MKRQEEGIRDDTLEGIGNDRTSVNCRETRSSKKTGTKSGKRVLRTTYPHTAGGSRGLFSREPVLFGTEVARETEDRVPGNAEATCMG